MFPPLAALFSPVAWIQFLSFIQSSTAAKPLLLTLQDIEQDEPSRITVNCLLFELEPPSHVLPTTPTANPGPTASVYGASRLCINRTISNAGGKNQRKEGGARESQTIAGFEWRTCSADAGARRKAIYVVRGDRR